MTELHSQRGGGLFASMRGGHRGSSNDPMATAHREIEQQLAFMKRRDKRDGRGGAGAVGNFNSNFNTNWSVRKAEQGNRDASGSSGQGVPRRSFEPRKPRGGQNKESSDFMVAKKFRQNQQGRR